MFAYPTDDCGFPAHWFYAEQIDRESRKPIYEQIADIYRGRIQRGEWPAESRIPSEPDLAAEVEVNRDTIRRAVRELVETHWLVVVRGKGTFVLPESERQ